MKLTMMQCDADCIGVHPSMKHRITVNLDSEDYSALLSLAKQNDRSLSWLASCAVKKYLEQYDSSKQQELPLTVEQGE